MQYTENGVRDVQIAYIGGGSRGWAWGLMSDLMMERRMSGRLRLYDINHEAAKRNARLAGIIARFPEMVSDWETVYAPSLGEALDGADIVVISILPGTFAEMRSDVHLPERLGIYQSVGDTAGPGGVVRSLRTVPMMTEIGKAIERYAPGAWVINYTNPMAMCLRGLYDAFPGIRAFGCCHEVFGTQRLLCAVLAENGIPDVRRQDIHANVMGVNHFTWFESASYRGHDLFPLYRTFIEKHYDSGYQDEGKDWRTDYFKSEHRVKMDLFLRHGAIAAAGDRHLAEFVSHGYLKSPETAHDWHFILTPVEYRERDLQEKLARQQWLLNGEEAWVAKDSGEEGVALMLALLGLGETVSNVNLPNVGQIANLPMGAVVETNALFRRDSLRPVFAGEMPEEVLKLTLPHVQIQDLLLTAATECRFEAALEAMMMEPLTTCTQEEGQTLLRDMIGNTLGFLPKAWSGVL